MKKLHKFLKVFIFVQLGICVSRVSGRYIDFVKHPEVYAVQSAPWYYSIIFSLIFTAIAVLVTTIAYFVVGRIIKEREQELK